MSRTVDLGRVKILRVPVRDMVQFVRGLVEGPPRYVSVPKVCDIPEGAEVVSHYINPQTGCFEVLVSHPSFEPILVGETPPLLMRDTVWRMYALATEEELRARPILGEGDPVPVIAGPVG